MTSGSTSSPLTLQFTSMWGLAGPVTFACTGLPVAATCSFAPAQVTLADGSSATTSLTLTSTKQTAKLNYSTGVFAAMFLPLPKAGVPPQIQVHSDALRNRNRFGSAAGHLNLIGCSSGPPAPVVQPTTGTVLVTATSGPVSRSIPVNVTVQ